MKFNRVGKPLWRLFWKYPNISWRGWIDYEQVLVRVGNRLDYHRWVFRQRF